METAVDGELSETFHPERTHILSAIVLGLISLITIGAAPQYLFWILAFPILFVYWVLKSSTVVDNTGIHANYAFRGDKVVAWEDFSGVGFKGARSFARTTSGEEFSLPGVSFNSLPRLQEASFGRIPDALTAGRDAMDGKVVLVKEDGYSVMLTKEEYIARQKALGKEIQINFDEDNAEQDASDGNSDGDHAVEISEETTPTSQPPVVQSEPSKIDDNPASKA